ncbi:MAG: hypothetical protein COY80_03240 [Candidatus Pacebacteria bacterium CG_4_10_14_0_8_um_filter_42_14]|nr:MAG: hypothetical protein COY80_03240 [Candidatus Pacebacteria bacterium CG_4_10_14_0_8_um_filter_42_14]
MKNKKPKNEKNTAASMVLPVAGVIVGAAVMAAVSNRKNQKQAQVLLEKVKNKASSYMKTAQEEAEVGKKKVVKTLGVVQDTDKKVTSIWKK